jgi:5'-nucleotidase
MGFLLNDAEAGRDWKSYFDYIVVDAKKPLFFDGGTPLKVINIETKRKEIGCHIGPLEVNKIYSGGSCSEFTSSIGSKGNDILYFGDHINSDIVKSKKKVSWHTFLVVPELAKELTIWHKKKDLFMEIESLNQSLSKLLL